MAATVLTVVTKQETYGVTKVTLTIPTTIDATDGATAKFSLPRALAIGVQLKGAGTLSGKTVAIQAAPDQTNYAALPTTVSFTSSGIASVASIDTAFLYYRVLVNGAAGVPLGDEITVTIIANQI